MRLLRFGGRGIEKPGLVDAEGRIRDLSVHLSDLDETIISPAALAALRQLDWRSLPVIASDVRLGPILEHTNRLICITAGESGISAGAPISTALKGTRPTGPGDAIVIPRQCTCIRFRVALGVVIGTALRNANASRARAGIAGYCVAGDVTDADASAVEGQRALAGSAETFAPLGPYLVTSDEINDPGELRWWLELNGARHSSGKMSNGTVGIFEMVSSLSHVIRLWPSDIVLVAGSCDTLDGASGPALLQPGDATVSGIAKLGEQHQHCVAEGD
jgi:hypothetical protein